jgi:hypothetical protein
MQLQVVHECKSGSLHKIRLGLCIFLGFWTTNLLLKVGILFFSKKTEIFFLPSLQHCFICEADCGNSLWACGFDLVDYFFPSYFNSIAGLGTKNRMCISLSGTLSLWWGGVKKIGRLSFTPFVDHFWDLGIFEGALWVHNLSSKVRELDAQIGVYELSLKISFPLGFQFWALEVV